MIWTLLALISMVALGGFISYYGDLQGRRWGKKRVSWFGMRPKHTAIVITSITGAFIALFSIATVLLIAPPVRRIALHGEQAIRDNKDLNAQYERKNRDYENILREKSVQEATAQAKYSALNLDLEQATKELHETQQQKTESKRQLDLLFSKNKTLQISFYQTERSLKQRLVKIASLEREAGALTRKQAALTRDIRGLNKMIAAETFTNTNVGRQNYDLMRQRTALETTTKSLTEKNAALTQLRTSLEKDAAELNHKNQVLLDSNKTLLDANAETIRQNEDKARELESKIQQLTLQRDQLYGLLENADGANDRYAALRQQPIVLRSGEMLARRVLDAHSRPEATRRELQELMSDANAVALLRRAGSGENGRSVMLLNRKNVALAGSQASDERSTLDAFVERLTGQNAPMLITAKTLTNTVTGEQAIVDFVAQTITPTFRKGEVVAQSGLIDGAKPTRQVTDSIVQFLQTDVRDAAIKRGVTPQIDAQTGAQQVGSFGPADLVELTEKVRRMNGPVTITAVAAQSLNSAEPLRLDFRLSRPRKDL